MFKLSYLLAIAIAVLVRGQPILQLQSRSLNRVCVSPYLSIGICNKNSSSYGDFTGFEPEVGSMAVLLDTSSLSL